MNKKDNELVSKLDRLYLDLPICSVDLASCVYEASIRMVELAEENERLKDIKKIDDTPKPNYQVRLLKKKIKKARKAMK
jgi:hypothetical protein